ncbi:hypothetical protein V8E53_004237 [Lactarius tabidus]
MSTRLPPTPTPSTCFSSCIFLHLVLGQLVFLLDPPHLPSLVQTPERAQVTDDSVQRPTKLFLGASLLLEGDPSRNDEQARESCSSSDHERDARPVRQTRSRCPPCWSTREGSCRAGLLATRQNGACPREKARRSEGGICLTIESRCMSNVEQGLPL